ncbi:MAG: PLD phosphodiesterase domain-containing protein [Nitrospira sp.]|nr:MAG: PLD phosphodiesterase domain-containing protein [Nitrospira sp.]
MSNTAVHGRILDEQGAGIAGLTVRAIDFDPFFNEDDVLGTGKTEGDGTFLVSYSTDAYRTWKADRNPDLVVQVLGPPHAEPKLFGTRLLHETPEAEDVTDSTHEVGTITIHRNNIEGWLVTHTTLNPAVGTPVALYHHNRITHLIDGATMFPAVTDAAAAATETINLMTLFFDVNNGFLTKFKSNFDPLNPPSTGCKQSAETTLEEVLKTKGGKPVNILVTNLPLSAEDTVTEVAEFFAQTPGVSTNAFNKGFALLHAKAIVVDGRRAILMGSPLKQYYFSDTRHAIRDARHKGSLMHDVNTDLTGPAVAHVERTFASVWNATGKPMLIPPPKTFPDLPTTPDGDVASVQVLRTLPGSSITRIHPSDEDLPYGETGILEAYERAIANAQRYIYIENQYFTSHEIVDALISRMKDTTKPRLEIILVLNLRPDLPGYPDRQIDNVNQLRAAASAGGHHLGAYTLWSRSEKPGSGGAGNPRHYDVMPVYVHSKLAIIDDVWATVGSANLDGTSLNYHEIGLIVGGALLDRLIDKAKLTNDPGKFLWELFWYLFFFVFKQILFDLKTLLILLFVAYKLIFDFKETLETIRETLGDVADIPQLVKDMYTRTAQHALPSRSRQPSRSVELNVVIYNGIAGLPENGVVRALRHALWQEHFGLASLPDNLKNLPAGPAALNWVAEWEAAATHHIDAIKNDLAPPADHGPHLLPWKPETDPKDYLAALKIRTSTLRSKAQKFDFSNCKVDDKKSLLPWPII